MNEYPKCKDRVKREYRERMVDLRKLWKSYCAGEERVSDDLGNLFEYGLGFDYVYPGTFRDQRRGYFRYQLSWGGPGDEFRYYVDDHMRPYKVEYWFLDWWDGAKVTVRSGKNFELLLEIFGWFDEMGKVKITD